MSIKKLGCIQFLFLFFITGLLTSCGGGASGDPDTPSTPGASITLQARSSQGTLQTSFTAGESITLSIKARNDFGRGAANVTVSVSTSLGSVAQADVLTDSNGEASIQMLTTEDLAGVATVTATATIDGSSLTATKTLQINAPIPQEPAELTVSILDSACETQLNSQSAGNQFCVIAQYSQDGVGIEGEIVSFSTTLGTIAPAQALTEQSGIAKAVISSTLDDVNAGQLTATVGTTSASKNFQFTAPQASDIALSLTVLDASCNTPLNSVSTGESLCLKAQLTTNGLPNADEILQFNAPIGTLQQATALTQTDGYATVILDSDGSTLGAAEASVTYSALSATANYQFTSVAPPVSSGVSVELTMTVNDVVNNRFRSNQSARLLATVLDSNDQPIINEIVTFTAELGTLQTTTALTDSLGTAQVTLSGTSESLGEGVATASRGSVSDTLNYEILAENSVEQEIKLGHFNGEDFVEGVIGLSGQVVLDSNDNVILSAGGTLGLEVVLVDQDLNRFTSPTEISFTSSCTVKTQATLDETTTSVNGSAKSTYEDVSCAGAEGNQDTVVASVQVNGVTVSAYRGISLQPESVGAIQFISANPESIVLKGTSGQGSQEASTLTFRVIGELGNPLSQRVVNFSLDTSVGNTSLNPIEGLTNSEGLVTTRVTAGTVPTPVRVTASVQIAENENITTQSDLVSISTGLADQNSMTLATSLFNPEAHSQTGVEATITAFLSDTFNNPVPDGTTVLFTTEGGSIAPSCNTQNGSCSVIWRSTDPRVDDHRITILATAIGHETFTDLNGNNVYDDSDGPAINDSRVDSGLVRQQYPNSGFGDMSEAWRDDNENYQRDNNELFIDYNGINSWDSADGKFNGPQCDPSVTESCSVIANNINVRRALVMSMSSSEARVVVYTANEVANLPSRAAPFNDDWIIYANDKATQGQDSDVSVDGNIPQHPNEDHDCFNSTADICLLEGESINLTFALADSAGRSEKCDNSIENGSQPGQPLPALTTASVITTAGSSELLGTTELLVPNALSSDACAYGGHLMQMTLANTNSSAVSGEQTSTGILQISITYPTSNRIERHSLNIEMIGR